LAECAHLSEESQLERIWGRRALKYLAGAVAVDTQKYRISQLSPAYLVSLISCRKCFRSQLHVAVCWQFVHSLFFPSSILEGNAIADRRTLDTSQTNCRYMYVLLSGHKLQQLRSALVSFFFVCVALAVNAGKMALIRYIPCAIFLFHPQKARQSA